MTEIDVKEIDVEVVNKIGVSSTGSVTASTEDSKDLDITVSKKEFVITGDDVYIGTIHEDTPEWLNNLVSSAVDLKVGQSSDQLLAQVGSNLSAFATEYVKLNAYNDEIAVISNGLSNTTVHVNSLDATYTTEMTKAKADIVNLDEVKVDATRATSISAGVIQSQLNTPTSALGATVSRLDVAIAEERAVRASEVDAVEVRLHDAELGISGHSSAISTLDSRVTVVDGKATANASAVTQLHTDLQSGSGTWANADSQVTNTLNTRISNNRTEVEAKWAYNATININGIYKKSGFGLTTNYTSGSGTVGDPYVSEFWIDATRMKFTNSAQTGRSAPFSIEASGATPLITFNGRVSFTNFSNPSSEIASTVNAGTSTIDGGKITATSITANQIAGSTITGAKIAAGAITADKMTVSSLSAITANIGTITAGYLRNSSGANYVNLDASGANPFLRVGGNVSINADGSGYFARSIVSAPNIIASAEQAYPADGTLNPSGFTAYIDTGVNVSGSYFDSSSDMYLASATIAHGYSPSGYGISGWTEATVAIGDGLRGGNFYGSSVVDNRIYIKVVFQRDYGWNDTYITAIAWKLARV